MNKTIVHYSAIVGQSSKVVSLEVISTEYPWKVVLVSVLASFIIVVGEIALIIALQRRGFFKQENQDPQLLDETHIDADDKSSTAVSQLS